MKKIIKVKNYEEVKKISEKDYETLIEQMKNPITNTYKIEKNLFEVNKTIYYKFKKPTQ